MLGENNRLFYVNERKKLSAKSSPFFDDKPLLEFAAEIWRAGEHCVPPLRGEQFKAFVRKISSSVANMRLERTNGCRKTFVASGLSMRPVNTLT